MFSLIGAIIIGFFAGLIARAIHPGDDKAGFVVTTVLGVIGALLATFLGRALGWYADGQAAGFIMSIVGAVVVLFIYNMVTRNKRQI